MAILGDMKLLTIGGNTYTVPSPSDYVVETGTDGIWAYRKWNSGIAECWGRKVTTGYFSAWGQVYAHDVAAEAYPSGLFVENPLHFVSGRGINSHNTVSSANSSGGTEYYTPGITHVRATSISDEREFESTYYAYGRWK